MVENIKVINNTLGTSLSLSMYNNNYILKSVDWGVVESQRKTYKFLNQYGEYVTGITLNSREISIIGWCVGYTQKELKERKEFLNKFVNPLHEFSMIYNGYKISGIPKSSISYGTEEKDNNDIWCKFSISIFCPDPMFHKENENIESVAEWIPMFEFPLEIPEDEGIVMGERSTSTITKIVNDGSIPCGFKIYFEASGTVENPEIIEINTQQKIKFKYTMNAGEVLVLSTVENKKTVEKISGGITENAFNLLDFENTKFFNLLPGENYIRYGSESGIENLTVTVVYDPSYLEVQTL